jgi:uncharacterized protein YjbJ (UPF0337 family)
MNAQIFNGTWEEIKGKIKQKWSVLTDDDLLKLEGKHEEIYGLLEKHYGYARDEVKKMLDKF